MPALPPLVTAADLTAYGYDTVPDGLLARASARVRRYTRQQITPGTSTVTVTGDGPWLLPQRPVTAVVSVTDADGDAVSDYELRGQWLHSSVCGPLEVAYEHGYDTLPDDLVELVCAIAARLGEMPGAVGAGARTEQSGGESVTWGVEAYTSASGLTRGEQAALNRIYPNRPRSVRLI